MNKYSTPEFRSLGSLTGLTLGQGGSCMDGTGEINQFGGGLEDPCGQDD